MKSVPIMCVHCDKEHKILTPVPNRFWCADTKKWNYIETFGRVHYAQKEPQHDVLDYVLIDFENRMLEIFPHALKRELLTVEYVDNGNKKHIHIEFANGNIFIPLGMWLKVRSELDPYEYKKAINIQIKELFKYINIDVINEN